jgi:capsular exopolysaccharide synthesis family protein
MLVHEAKTGNLRVLMVTSALGGEGKTSLSCHLATSLARAGFRTVIVDADLRNPSVAGVFDISNDGGLAALLRGECDVDAALLPTPHADLAVVPAGDCDDAAIRGLNRGHLHDLLEELKRRFDFVVVDTAPVLPVADTLSIAPYVDAVVLSTLRDVSRLPKVFAAYQKLGLLGVRILGAVVTGIYGGLYGNDYRYPYPYGGRPRDRRESSESDSSKQGEA